MWENYKVTEKLCMITNKEQSYCCFKKYLVFFCMSDYLFYVLIFGCCLSLFKLVTPRLWATWENYTTELKIKVEPEMEPVSIFSTRPDW